MKNTELLLKYTFNLNRQGYAELIHQVCSCGRTRDIDVWSY